MAFYGAFVQFWKVCLNGSVLKRKSTLPNMQVRNANSGVISVLNLISTFISEFWTQIPTCTTFSNKTNTADTFLALLQTNKTPRLFFWWEVVSETTIICREATVCHVHLCEQSDSNDFASLSNRCLFLTRKTVWVLCFSVAAPETCLQCFFCLNKWRK